MEWTENVVVGRYSRLIWQPPPTPRGPETTQAERDSKTPRILVAIPLSTSMETNESAVDYNPLHVRNLRDARRAPRMLAVLVRRLMSLGGGGRPPAAASFGFFPRVRTRSYRS